MHHSVKLFLKLLRKVMTERCQSAKLKHIIHEMHHWDGNSTHKGWRQEITFLTQEVRNPILRVCDLSQAEDS